MNMVMHGRNPHVPNLFFEDRVVNVKQLSVSLASLAYSTGLFETKEIFRRGILLDFLGVVILSFVVIWIWKLLGVVVLV